MPEPVSESVRAVYGQRAYGSIYSSQYADAAKSARANELATRLGMAPDVVEADFPNMLAEDRLRRRVAEARRNEAYARIMANWRLASAGIDDDALPKVAERVASHASAPARAGIGQAGGIRAAIIGNLFSGTAGLAEGLFGIAQGLGEGASQAPLTSMPLTNLAGRALALTGRSGGEVSERAASATRIRTGSRNLNDILSGVESVPSSALALGITVGTGGNFLLGAGALGAITGGRSYREGRRAGLTPDQAAVFGATDAAIETGTELLPERILGRMFLPGGDRSIREAAKALGVETVGEQVATTLQELNRWYWLERPRGKSFSEYLGELPDELRSTAVATLTTFGITAGGGLAVRKAIDEYQDRQAAERVDGIMEAAAASETRQANPTQFAEALNQLVGDTAAENLFIPADQVQALFQTDEGAAGNIADDAFWGRYAAQVEEAAALGGDVVIPLSEAATHLAGTPQWAKLKDHVRVSAGGASIAEAKARQTPEELEKLAASIAQGLQGSVRTAQQREAMRVVGKWSEGLGYIGDRAKAINRYLAAWLANAHAAETSKRLATGEEVPSLAAFAQAVLPSREKTAQADFQAGERAANDTVAAAAAAQTPEQTRARIKRKRPKARGPQRVIAFIRSIGGIKDVEGHDLSKGRDLRRHPGLINNKRGRMLDDVGELLWERGYFGLGASRPTVDDVLQLIERDNREPVYPLAAQAEQLLDEQEARRREADEAEGGEAAARAEIGETLARLGLDFTDDDKEIALAFMADGQSAEDAVSSAVAEIEMQLLEELDEESETGYGYADVADAIFAEQQGQGGFEGGIPGFDDLEGPEGTREPGPGEPGSTLSQTIVELFGEPDQPQRSMTQAQRAELEARQQQSMSRRGGQESLKDQEGGLFSAERDQDTLFDTARGNISITRDEAGFMSAALIRAFESANFSTAIHELGHFFLEDLRTRALRDDATVQEKADWDTFKAWALDDLDGLLVADDKLIPTEAHEFFARGMERYVWEGQAPAKGLRALFARMREFMLELYRTAKAFNAPITPEIRRVMDRMLASEAEIAEAQAEMQLASDAIDVLLTDEERAEYAAVAGEAREEARERLLERILSSLRSERTAEVREIRRDIRAEVEAEVDARPVFQALKMLRTGIPDEDGNRAKVRLSREWLVDAYGEEVIGQLPKGVPPIVGDTDTMDADQIAGLTGFNSGDEMVKALIEHEAARAAAKASGDNRSPRSRLVEETTDARLRDEIGDPFEDLEDEARAALANDQQAEAISLQLRALARKAGRKPTPWKLATEWAKARIATETTKDALSGRMLQQYARNAAKAGQAVEEALAGQDFEAAFLAKQRQLLNLALLQEARRAKESVDKAVRRMQRTAGKTTIASIDQDYLDQAHALLEDVDFKARPQTQVDKRLAFEAWHAVQVANGVEPVVPPEYRRLLGTTHWSRLPIDELLELDRAVGQIIELGRLKQRLRDSKAERDYEEGVAELVDTAGRLPPRNITADLDPNRKFTGRIKSRLRGIDAAMVKVEQMVDWLDGGNSNGPWNRLIFGVMAEAQGRENDLKRDYVARINGLIKALPASQVREWDRLVDTPELVINIRDHPQRGQAFQFTKDQVVMMAMNWGNEGNRQRLLDGFGWREEQVLSVFDRLMTKQDWDFVQGVWDTVDGLWPEIEALERRVNGVAPEKVAATEVLTRHGAYRGGYFPAVYDPLYSSRAELDEAAKLSPNGAWHHATTRASSTKARAAQVKGRPLLLNMGVITRHLGEVIHDVTHREAVGQVRKLLADRRVRSSVSATLGPEYLKRMGAWLENVATPNASNSKSDPSMVAIARHLNKGVSLVGLGFRISSALVQPLGLSNMIGVMGEAGVANGIRIATAHPVATYREVMSRSAEMRSRFSTMDASIEEMAAEANAGKLSIIGPRGLVRHAFDGILYMDMLITTAGWVGAFNKGLNEGMNEDEATYYADKVIRTSQGAGGHKDRSAILYENQFARTFWPFFSYLNALYNQQRDVFRRARHGDYAEAARRAWWVMIVPPLVQALLFGDGPDEDDEEGWAAYLTKAAMFGNLAAIPGIGPIANAIGNGYGYRSNAWQGIGEGIKKAWEDADRALEGEPIKGSSVKGVMTTVGIVLAKPLGQIGATSQGVWDYARGEVEPEDTGDWYELLTKGRISEQPTAAERLVGEEE